MRQSTTEKVTNTSTQLEEQYLTNVTGPFVSAELAEQHLSTEPKALFTSTQLSEQEQSQVPFTSTELQEQTVPFTSAELREQTDVQSESHFLSMNSCITFRQLRP